MIDIENSVFTRIEYLFSDDLKEKYEGLNFTTDDVNIDVPVFPNVYISLLSGYEIGSTLEGNTINGLQVSMQIKVTDNVSKERSKEIMAECVRLMKSMLFTVNQYPTMETIENTYVTIARFRRVLGDGDTL